MPPPTVSAPQQAVPDSGCSPRLPAAMLAACVMPAGWESVPTMRRFATSVARHWGMPDATHDALALIVSELVTNSVRHSGSCEVSLVLAVEHSHIRVSVLDAGRWRRRRRRPGHETETATCGRGLMIVDAYADEVTFRRHTHGSCVTARVMLRSGR